jgi:hypothetical protein
MLVQLDVNVTHGHNPLVMRADALKRGLSRISRAPVLVSIYEREEVDHFALSDA